MTPKSSANAQSKERNMDKVWVMQNYSEFHIASKSIVLMCIFSFHGRKIFYIQHNSHSPDDPASSESPNKSKLRLLPSGESVSTVAPGSGRQLPGAKM